MGFAYTPIESLAHDILVFERSIGCLDILEAFEDASVGEPEPMLIDDDEDDDYEDEESEGSGGSLDYEELPLEDRSGDFIDEDTLDGLMLEDSEDEEDYEDETDDEASVHTLDLLVEYLRRAQVIRHSDPRPTDDCLRCIDYLLTHFGDDRHLHSVLDYIVARLFEIDRTSVIFDWSSVYGGIRSIQEEIHRVHVIAP
jgi:hypothetical protein